MPLTFPLTLAQFCDLLPVSTVRFDLPEALDVAETNGGEVLTADIGTTLWSGQIDMALLDRAEAAAVLPLIQLLRRAGTSFLVSDHRRPWPRLDPNGTILGAATPTILAIDANRRELSLQGLPAGYPLRRGDLLSFTHGTAPVRYALHELVGDVTAAGGGTTALVEVNPPIRPGATTGTAVQLVKARCKARLVPGETDLGTTQRLITTGVSLRWTQTLR